MSPALSKHLHADQPRAVKPADPEAIRALHTTLGAATAYHVGTLAVRTRCRAWMENPTCLTCAQPIADVAQSGLVKTPQGDRVACRDACYVAAILVQSTLGASAERSIA